VFFGSISGQAGRTLGGLGLLTPHAPSGVRTQPPVENCKEERAYSRNFKIGLAVTPNYVDATGTHEPKAETSGSWPLQL